jgi:hypothetical protein
LAGLTWTEPDLNRRKLRKFEQKVAKIAKIAKGSNRGNGSIGWIRSTLLGRVNSDRTGSEQKKAKKI